jgi:type I restriction enzyme M protein
MNASTLVQKLWNYCNVLRDDGMSYGDYVEQLTYLLFLKMADERTRPPHSQKSIVPAAYSWPTLLKEDGDRLFDHYRHVLEELGKEKGTLGLIFGKAQNKFQDPAKLRRVIADLIDAETWTILGADVKGDAYEGLLEKNAQDTKSGAGQYFTPRALIQAMVDCIAPKPGETICDPACGTGGFLFTAHNCVVGHNKNLTRDQLKHLKEKAFTGYELVQATARVCAMNLMLHGIGSEKSVPVIVGDALAADPGKRFDVVLANPPFGKKSSTVIVGEDGRTSTEKDIIERDDFWATTSNKQLNFVQHIKTLLDIPGRAAGSWCSLNHDPRPWCCRTTCCSRAGRGRSSGADCFMSAKCTRCCGCPRACSTRKASRPTCCSSTRSRRARRRGQRSCGFTIFGRTSTSPSRRIP